MSDGAPARAVVAVGSGKGGVGKSTISLNLALALAKDGNAVGLLDADFYGPDIPLMINLKQTRPLEKWALWRHRSAGGLRLDPVRRFGIEVMSVGFLLAEDQPMLFPGQMVEFVGRQLIHDVAWSELDYLIVDLPPGTADVQQQLLRLIPLAGAVVVVSPQDVAHLDAKKLVTMLRGADVPVLGAVENMSGLVCPHCGEHVDVFPPGPEERSLWALGVARLGAIPLDPTLASAGDRGRPVVVDRPDGPQAEAFRRLAACVVAALDGASA